MKSLSSILLAACAAIALIPNCQAGTSAIGVPAKSSFSGPLEPPMQGTLSGTISADMSSQLQLDLSTKLDVGEIPDSDPATDMITFDLHATLQAPGTCTHVRAHIYACLGIEIVSCASNCMHAYAPTFDHSQPMMSVHVQCAKCSVCLSPCKARFTHPD